MKKIMKKLRGMTLVEIIVALAVFAMLSLVLVTMGNAAERHSRAARSLNSRVAVEGPIAEAQNGNESYLADNAYQIRVAKGQKTTDASGNEVLVMPSKGFVSIEGTLCYVNPELGTNATDVDGSVIPDPTADPGDYSFKYIAVPKPTGTMAPLTTEDTP